MANLKVKVPIEIEDYKERIILGLSLRQLAWGSIAILCGAPTFLLLKQVNTDLATYLTMAVSAPAFCMGFVRSKEGYTFEYLVKIRFNSMFGKSKRPYETEISNNIIPQEIIEFRELYNEVDTALAEQQAQGGENLVSLKNKKGKRVQTRAKGKTKTEYDLVEITKKSAEKQRKAALSYIKATRGGNKPSKPKESQAATQRSCTDNGTADDKIQADV